MASLQSTQAPLVFKLGSVLGHGAYGKVYRAVEMRESTRGAVALKKSRVSLRVKRTILQHESRILQLLQGHPMIPAVYAYGRFEHFEYFAMELLGSNVKELSPHPRGAALNTVLLLADQMLSVLEHIHSRGIIHRDIKPENMLLSLQNPSRICLIDFGIARYYPTGTPACHDPIIERKHIMGTLNWASLNAHYGLDLSRRDDIESLAYTLLFLIRGDLPWRKDDHRGTVFGTMAHVREQKKAWPGSRLAEGYPAEFGQLLDHARSLDFNEKPDYSRFQRMFKDLYQRSGFADDGVFDWSSVLPSHIDSGSPPARETPDPSPVLTAGQLVYVQVLASPSIEGDLRLKDTSHWHDPSFAKDEWQSPPRPAVVVQCVFNPEHDRHEVVVAALKRGQPPDPILSVRIGHGLERQDVDAWNIICTRPPWILPDTYCYTFSGLDKFTTVDDQPIPAYYQIHADDVQILSEKLAVGDWKLPNPEDANALESMRKRSESTVFVRITPIRPDTIERTTDGSRVDWTSHRGWFDELVKISKRRAWDDGWPWTGTLEAAQAEEGAEELSDSYFGWDIADWEIQEERDLSLTLPPGESDLLDAHIERIGEIIAD